VAPLLRENVKRNGFEDKISVRRVAAGQDTGTVQFDVGPDDEVGWGGLTGDAGEQVTDASTGVIEVSQEQLDDIIEDYDIEDSIRLMKVDVEGAEAWVFLGSERLLGDHAFDLICFENNVTRAERLGIRKNEPFEILERHEYVVEEKKDDWWAKPKSNLSAGP
jgi:FkbM family methyltransferase